MIGAAEASEELLERLEGDGCLIADGLDGAIVGISYGPDGSRVVYDIERCVAVVMERDGMDFEEAREFLEFNTFCAWVGPRSPIYIESF